MSNFKDWQVSAIAVLCALLLHSIDTHSDDTQFAFFALVGFSFVLGVVQPEQAWRNGLIVAMGIGLPQLLATAGLYASPFRASALGACVIMAIGLVSGLAGKVIRAYMSHSRGLSNP